MLASLQNVGVTDKATFHVSGYVDHHNVCIWGSEHPHSMIGHIRDSPKVNVRCGLMADRVIGPFFFFEPTVTKKVLDLQISHL